MNRRWSRATFWSAHSSIWHVFWHLSGILSDIYLWLFYYILFSFWYSFWGTSSDTFFGILSRLEDCGWGRVTPRSPSVRVLRTTWSKSGCNTCSIQQPSIIGILLCFGPCLNPNIFKTKTASSTGQRGRRCALRFLLQHGKELCLLQKMDQQDAMRIGRKGAF